MVVSEFEQDEKPDETTSAKLSSGLAPVGGGDVGDRRLV